MSFTVRATSELRVTEVEEAETSLNRAIELASDALIAAGSNEPFVFGELTSATSWTMRIEFAAEGDSLEDLMEETHRTTQQVLHSLGFPPSLAVAITQSSELVPA